MKEFAALLLVWLAKLSVALMAIIQLLIAVSGHVVNLVIELTEWAFANIATLVLPNWSFDLSEHQETLALVNHFFPLAEGIAMVVAAVPFMFTVVLLRFIKSWIPTMGN